MDSFTLRSSREKYKEIIYEIILDLAHSLVINPNFNILYSKPIANPLFYQYYLLTSKTRCRTELQRNSKVPNVITVTCHPSPLTGPSR